MLIATVSKTYACPYCSGKTDRIITCPRCLKEQCPGCATSHVSLGGDPAYCGGCDFDVRLRAGGSLARMAPHELPVCSCNASNPSWDKCRVHAPKAASVEAERPDETPQPKPPDDDGGELEKQDWPRHDTGNPVG